MRSLILTLAVLFAATQADAGTIVLTSTSRPVPGWAPVVSPTNIDGLTTFIDLPRGEQRALPLAVTPDSSVLSSQSIDRTINLPELLRKLDSAVIGVYRSNKFDVKYTPVIDLKLRDPDQQQGILRRIGYSLALPRMR